jgi:hypothetical protein
MSSLRKLLATFSGSFTSGGVKEVQSTNLVSWQGYAVVDDLLALEYDVGKQ